MRTELEFLETQKRQLAKQRGSQASLKQLVAKQTALVRRWKEEAAELDKLLAAQRLADDRRRLMLEQDARLGRLRRETEVGKFARCPDYFYRCYRVSFFFSGASTTSGRCCRRKEASEEVSELFCVEFLNATERLLSAF